MAHDSGDEPGTRFNWSGWFVVGICLLLYLLSSIDRQIINLLVAPIQHEFGVGDFAMGLLIGPAFGLCYALATFPLAWLGDRMSRRWLIFGCVIVWAIAACASGLARSFEELFAVRIVVGIGEAGLLPCAYVLIAARFERHRLALPMSILTLGAVGGLAVAMGLGAWLLRVAGDDFYLPVFGLLSPWRAAFVLSGLPGFAFAFLILFVRDTAQRRDPATAARPDDLLRFIGDNRRIVVATLVGFGLLQIVSAAVVGWYPTHLIRAYGWTASQAGTAIAVTVLVVASTGKLLAGGMVDRLFARGRYDAHFRYAVATSLVALPFLLGSLFSPGGLVSVVLIAVYFLGPYASVGYGSAFVQLVTPPRLRGRMSGLFLLVCNLFAMLGPVLVGALTDQVFGDKAKIGVSLAIVVGVAFVIAVAVLLRTLRTVHDRLDPVHAMETDRI